MKIEFFLNNLEEELYELELTESQCDLIEVIQSDLRQQLPNQIDDHKAPILSLLIKNHIIYNEKKPLRELFEKIYTELNRCTAPAQPMQPTSLLCALYFLNDLIAVSSAMGVGTEESIIPNEKYTNVMCRLLKQITEPTEEAFLVIQRYRSGRQYQKARVVPLITDIIETSYIRLQGLKITELRQKQSNVDEFYHSKAECCMAKGTLLILRWLQQLPDEYLTILSGIPLERQLMKELQDCSSEAIATIQEESLRRRYRGGNSATTWLSLRKTIVIDPIQLPATLGSATSVAHLFVSEDQEVAASEFTGINLISLFSPTSLESSAIHEQAPFFKK